MRCVFMLFFAFEVSKTQKVLDRAMRASTFRLSKVLDIPQGLSARLSVEKKKLLRMSQQRGMLENVSGLVSARDSSVSCSRSSFSAGAHFG